MVIHIVDGVPLEITEEERANLVAGGAPTVFHALSARQLRLGLISGGFDLAEVEASIGRIDDAQERAKAMVEWEYASQFERTHPLIDEIGDALGLTSEQIDGLWVHASSL